MKTHEERLNNVHDAVAHKIPLLHVTSTKVKEQLECARHELNEVQVNYCLGKLQRIEKEIEFLELISDKCVGK